MTDAAHRVKVMGQVVDGVQHAGKRLSGDK
jgi:hypothetical protein